MFFFKIDLGPRNGLGHYKRVKSLINFLKLKKYKIIIDNKYDEFFLKNEKKI